MTERWRQFEEIAYGNLCERYPEIASSISLAGGSDSTESDILVESPYAESDFYVECKMPFGCHFGQMVLDMMEDADTASGYSKIYGPADLTAHPYMHAVLAEYNDKLRRDATMRYALDNGTCPEDEFDVGGVDAARVISDAVEGHYLRKGARFLITGRLSGRGLLVLPLGRGVALENVFDFSYVVRDKKSGSASCPKYMQERVARKLELDYGVSDRHLVTERVGGADRLYVYDVDRYAGLVANPDFELDDSRFHVGRPSDAGNEVRKLSNTARATLLLVGRARPDDEIPQEVFDWGWAELDRAVGLG